MPFFSLENYANTHKLLLLCVSGLTWAECLERCPQGVVPACHNAEDTVTISGPQVQHFTALCFEFDWWDWLNWWNEYLLGACVCFLRRQSQSLYPSWKKRGFSRKKCAVLVSLSTPTTWPPLHRRCWLLSKRYSVYSYTPNNCSLRFPVLQDSS